MQRNERHGSDRPVEAVGPVGPEIWVRGPVGGETEARRPQEEERPGRGAVSARRFAWVATHGGAGASTLAAVFGGHDAGRSWPRPDQGEPGSVLLVGRTHAAGLDAVSHTLDIFRRGDAPPGLDLDAIVLVADAPGRLPRQLTQRIKVIGSVIDVYRVPWMPAWRTGDLTVPLPRETAPLARLTGGAA
ncbi:MULTISPECIES: DUF6668 family protein [Streptomyces]|uniref:Uncharacterized protein n=1 Tax=Streptomyces dengpaensis TaxID=2049881 RepID=A0ABN5IDJ2_9ACTN|nr:MULTISPECIES: DUF6668 family protein [Streptomyces]AVH61231.1 hypothetical protein C4B68_16600 [Streptomyces dengpaensis]PIB09191.1 hypothetical protein B1C81_11910 [Streptomyces sp. HG99]